jgi:uncharacterized GH25 family protein
MTRPADRKRHLRIGWRGLRPESHVKLAVFVIGTVAVAATTADAGDVWLITDQSHVADGDPVWVSVARGAIFPFADQPTSALDVAEILDRGPTDARPVVGMTRQDANLSVRRPLVGAGVHVIGCTMRPEEALRKLRSHSQDSASARPFGEKFGPDGVATPPESTESQNDDDIVELRFAKTIVGVEPVDPASHGHWRTLGHELEIVPVTNPCHWRAGQDVKVCVLLEDHPWPGVKIQAGHEGCEDASFAYSTTTDSEGFAVVPMTQAGHWFIKAELRRPFRGLARGRTEILHAMLTFRARRDAAANSMAQSATAAPPEAVPAATTATIASAK